MDCACKELFLRADSDPVIGSGHVMRCLALAQAWQAKGGSVTFIGQFTARRLRDRILNVGAKIIDLHNRYPDPSDFIRLSHIVRTTEKKNKTKTESIGWWIAVDGYHFDSGYFQALQSLEYPVLIIDDVAHRDYYPCQILLNQNIDAVGYHYQTKGDTIRLLGSRYVLLRSEFLDARTWAKNRSNRSLRLLVSFGGADPSNGTQLTLEALSLLEECSLMVKVVAGPLNTRLKHIDRIAAECSFPVEVLANVRDMASVMAWADLAVVAPGTTCWELLYMGLPALMVITADNQVGIADGLQRTGLAINCGRVQDLTASKLAKLIRMLCLNTDLRARIESANRGFIDGKGAQRVVDQMVKWIPRAF